MDVVEIIVMIIIFIIGYILSLALLGIFIYILGRFFIRLITKRKTRRKALDLMDYSPDENLFIQIIKTLSFWMGIIIFFIISVVLIIALIKLGFTILNIIF